MIVEFCGHILRRT